MRREAQLKFWSQAGVVSAGVIAALCPQAVLANDEKIDTDFEEIVVTGYTISEAIDMATGLGLKPEETPQSVSIMTAQRIEDMGLRTVREVVANAVGVSSQEYDNVRNGFFSRGFAIQNYQIDGVPMAWSLAADHGETIADVAIFERVEFVRGATGLLTGAGDPSASINLVRKHASMTDFEGTISAGYGRWNNIWGMIDVGSALNESGSIRVRAVAKYEDTDSYIDLYENKKLVLYGVLEADITENTLFRVGASYQDNKPTSPAWGALPTFYADGSFTDWERSKTGAAPWTKWDTSTQNYFANLSHDFGNDWRLVVNYNRLVDEQATRLLYLYSAPDRDTGLGMFSYPYRSYGITKQDSFDAQLKGSFQLFGQDHDIVVGGLHSKQTNDTTEYGALAFPAVGDFNMWPENSFEEPGWADGILSTTLVTKQTGFYGVARISLTDAFKVIAGGRVAKWSREGLDFYTPVDFGDNGVFIPYAGATYEVAENHRIYASYTEIFRPQNERDRNGGFLDPLTGNSMEIGFKSSWLDDALQTSVAYFIIEQDNLAVADPGFLVPGTINPAKIAAKGTESKGFEVEIVGEPLPGLNLGIGYTSFNAEDADGVAVNRDNPDKLLKIFGSYNFSNNLEGLTIGGGVNWQNEVYTEGANPITTETVRLTQESYALVNLMARYAFNEQLSVQLNLENILDKKYYNEVNFFQQYRYGPPANYSLSLVYKF